MMPIPDEIKLLMEIKGRLEKGDEKISGMDKKIDKVQEKVDCIDRKVSGITTECAVRRVEINGIKSTLTGHVDNAKIHQTISEMTIRTTAIIATSLIGVALALARIFALI